MTSSGRDNRGEHNPNAQLDEEQVQRIYELCLMRVPDTEIAEDSSVTSTTVRKIRLGELWPSPDRPPIEYEVLAPVGERQTLRERANASATRVDECLISSPDWSRDSSGYPIVFMGKQARPKQPAIVRVLWLLERGSIPDGYVLKNDTVRCGHVDCFNLDHWLLMSRAAAKQAYWDQVGSKARQKGAARLARAEVLKVPHICAWDSSHVFYPERSSGKPQLYCSEKCRWTVSNAKRRSPKAAHGEDARFAKWAGGPIGDFVDADGKFVNCQHWLGKGRSPNGWANFMRDDQSQVDAHKYALERALGRRLAKDEWAMHACDARDCVRTDGEPGWYEVCGEQLPRFGHLVLGTARLNSLDMHAKGRGTQDKLTPHDVAFACQLYEEGNWSQQSIADRLGCAQKTISDVLRGLSYLHVRCRRPLARAL